MKSSRKLSARGTAALSNVLLVSLVDPCPLGTRFFLFLCKQRCKCPGEWPQPVLTVSCPDKISGLDTDTLTDSLWYVKEEKPVEFNSQASKIHMWYNRLPIVLMRLFLFPCPEGKRNLCLASPFLEIYHCFEICCFLGV